MTWGETGFSPTILRIFKIDELDGLSVTHPSHYCTERIGMRRKFAKFSIGTDVLQQIICTVKIRRLII